MPKSNPIPELHPVDTDGDSPWHHAADASGVAFELVSDIPGADPGDNGYKLLPETDEELRQAAALLEQANELLQQAADRETGRYETWCHDHAWVHDRGEMGHG